ncbi:MAG: hypothetical protein ABI554_14635 [Flavobacterium sp.]
MSKYSEINNIPKITKNLIQLAFSVLTVKTGKNRSSKPIYTELLTFYNTTFKHLNVSEIPAKNYSRILAYLSVNILTDFENTLKNNFFKALNLFINSYFLKENPNLKRKALYSITNPIKNDLVNGISKCDQKYHAWLKKFRKQLLPELIEDNHYLQLTKNPQIYLKHLIWINLQLEKLGLKNYQIFPIRTGGSPKYIPLDTAIIIDLFCTKGKGKMTNNIEESKTIWNDFFDLDHKIFKSRKYAFDYRILTDGIGCSIQFISKADLAKQTLKKNNLKEGRRKKREGKLIPTDKKPAIVKKVTKKITGQSTKKAKKSKQSQEFKYIEDVPQQDLLRLNKDFNLVFCDPGKRTLLTMLDNYDNRFNYTNQQLIFDCKRKTYKKLCDKKRYLSGILFNENLANIANLINFKTCNIKDFKHAIRLKNNLNKIILTNYTDPLYRKLKWWGYINKQKSETKLVRQIKDKFGNDKEAVLIIGDWSAKTQLRNFMPTPGIGLKKRLKRDFQVYLIDEWRTSKLHWKTKESCENLKIIDSKTGKSKKIHAVLRAKLENGCDGCINRDLNSVRNMRKIVSHLRSTGLKPERFKREKT